MRPFPVPVVPFGRGSQPAEDEELSYLSMPKEMHTFVMPSYGNIEAVAGATQAKRILENVHEGLCRLRTARSTPTRFSLAGLDAGQVALVNQVLGEGEVSVIVGGEPRVRYQESVFAGIWRAVHTSTDGRGIADDIEIGGIPADVAAAATRAKSRPIELLGEHPQGVINGPGVLAEIAERCPAQRPGAPAHVVNLTLLPLSEVDVAYIAQSLGSGCVVILSRGYGNCRIASTAVHNVWWVQYYNSQDALILNTIEVVDMPEAAVAAPEDLADSCDRLREVLNWVETGAAS